jgi:NAD(P)-dependent dehydrogenase (short-subunit alcohol dehydrogenase family)
MVKRSEGRIALVTGGAGALGRSVVERFLEEGAKVHVPVFAEDEIAGLRRHLGTAGEAVTFHRNGDLTDVEKVATIFAAVREAEGRGPEILLNLAGGFHSSPLEETDPGLWHRMWQMNATTAFLTSRAAFPEMKERGWGRILNVSAFPALDRGRKGLSAYGAAKAAVLNLTQTLAREGAGHGITANAIVPSTIDTPANREAMPDADTSAWLPPEEMAGVLAFLASDEARLVTGAAVTLTLG